MKNNSNTLINFIDSIFMVSGEMIHENGEDGYAFSLNDNCGIIGVFDGCGGLGARKYIEYNNKSGAYISSRVAAKTVLAWFDKFSEKKKNVTENIVSYACRDIKKQVVDELNNYADNTTSNVIKGTMTKKFPTTASIILFANKNKRLQTAYIWAGDSRGFVLQSGGLTQVTTDDIEGKGDALSNISDDSKLVNVISAEGDFALNYRVVNFEKPAILITATDGCFGYFSTPMEFEYMLLDSMNNSNSTEEWKSNIDKYIKQYTGDDYTIGIVVFGYKGYKKMKKVYIDRYKFLKKKYIQKIQKNEKIEQLWSEYKDYYYRGII